MSDMMAPARSPGAAEARPGGGVRRMNARPVILALGLAALAGGVIIYTFHQRTSENELQRQDQLLSKAVPKTGTPDVLANHPDAGAIEQNRHSMPARGETSSSEAPRAMSAGDQANVDAWDDYDRRKRALERARFEAEANAYGAAPDVRLSQGPQIAADAMSQTAVRAATSGQVVPSLDTMQAGPSAPATPVFGGMGGGLFGGGGAAMPPANPNANDQTGKRNFLAQPGSSADADYVAARVTAPISPYEVKAGSVIPATMIGGINSDLPGEVIGQVRENVYDTATGDHLLIPQGSRLVGVYHSGVTYGQTRVLVAWNRIIYPNGNSFDLGTMPGADEGAYSGFEDQVDNHYLRIFGSALLASVFSASAQLSQPQATNGEGISAQSTMTAAVGQQASQVGSQMIARGLDIQPTIEIRNGYLFNIMVTKDLVLTPWQGMQPLPYGAER
ncbi:MAG: TrbI/VirB10 family protein [Acetobacteraceae bacterium]|nr:TrbI/VirB10 family protein [Acetobacteraceae bacterium]